MNLEAIIRGCKKNDREAQKALFERYNNVLFSVSLKYCRNKFEAEDNVHDAFITIYQSIHKYRNEGSFEGWMKRIAIFKAINKYKLGTIKAMEIKDNLLEDTQVETTLAEQPLDILLKLIQELPDQYRLVFNLHQLDGYKHREIATMLDISEGTSKSNYHRAKVILRKKIIALKTDPNNKKTVHGT